MDRRGMVAMRYVGEVDPPEDEQVGRAILSDWYLSRMDWEHEVLEVGLGWNAKTIWTRDPERVAWMNNREAGFLIKRFVWRMEPILWEELCW